MSDAIKNNGNNQRSCYKYVKSRERATTVVNMGTRVEIVKRVKEKKYCTYCKNVGHVIEDCYSKKKYGQECTYYHKKDHIENVFGKKQKYGRETENFNVAEEIYHDQLFFGDDALACKNKTINKEIEQIFVADSGYTAHIANSLKI